MDRKKKVTDATEGTHVAAERRNDTISLNLGGNRITSDNFRKALRDFFSFIDEVSLQILGNKKAITWVVKVRKGSAVLTAYPEVTNGTCPNHIKNVFDSIEHGITTLEKKPERPSNFSNKALEYIQHLSGITSPMEGLEKISISVNRKPHALTSTMIANIDELFDVSGKAYGSIEGKLQTISERGKPTVTVYESLSDKAIRCHFDDDLFEDAMQAFGKRVYVFGLISYNRKGDAKSIRIEELRVFPEFDKIPHYQDICGIFGKTSGAR